MKDDRPWGISAIALFFVFGAAMSALSATLLAFPGSSLDRVWAVNQGGHAGLLQIGTVAVMGMAVVSSLCASAAVGLWWLRRWGLAIALALLAINIVGDLTNAALLRDYRPLIGVPVGGFLVAYLMKKRKIFT